MNKATSFHQPGKPPSEISCYSFPSTLLNNNGIWNGDSPFRHAFPLLILQLLLAFVTTRVIYFLLRPLKQPRIMSEILAGIVLGPSVLGRNKTFKELVFPERSQMLLDTIAMFGLMYFIFLIGVKLDPLLFKRLGRKEIIIGGAGVIFPLVITTALSFQLKDYFAKDMRNGLMLAFLGGVLAVSSFSALVPTLSELRLLNTEMGRLAVSLCALSDIYGWSLVVLFIPMQASAVSPMRGIWAFISVAALVSFIFFVIRPLTIWVIRHTPEGRPVEEVYIFWILVMVLVIGFLSDMIGANSYNGALVLGLAIPEGPPLGSTLVDRLENLIWGIFLPLFYLKSGLRTDVALIDNVSTWGYIQLIFVVGCLVKLFATLLPSLYFEMPFRQAFTLGIIMNCRGIPQIITFNAWMNMKLINNQSLTVLVLCTVAIIFIVTPIVHMIFKPSKHPMVQARRTIQHMRPDAELRVVVCVHNQANLPTLINLLEATHGAKRSLLSIISVHLVEMVGRTAPIFISHKLSRISSQSHHAGSSQAIHQAFIKYQQTQENMVSVSPFTTVAPYASMHNDVCTLASHRFASLIIVPYHKRPMIDGQMEPINGSIRSLNQKIVADAPCTVGILVDRAATTTVCTLSSHFTYDVATIFVGGCDDREALSYTARIVTNPSVKATVMRFIPTPSRGYTGQSRHYKMDAECIDEFKRKNMDNDRVSFQETVVQDVEQIVSAVRSLASESHDLLMVGMRHESNSLVSGGITEWTECPELGFIGDLLASIDFPNMTSVLIIHQHANPRLNVGERNQRVDRFLDVC